MTTESDAITDNKLSVIDQEMKTRIAQESAGIATIMRLSDAITNNKKNTFKPIGCICGGDDLILTENETRMIYIHCEECGHNGPSKFEANYVWCVMKWNEEVMRYESLLEDS